MNFEDEIRRRWLSLTKPPESLGRLEELVADYGRIRTSAMPALERKSMLIFCGDHGVTEEGVSAFPAEVTRQMVANFLRGGAAVSVLCRHHGIEPVVIDMGVRGPAQPGAIAVRIAEGTRNFAREAAMTRGQAMRAIDAGIELASGNAAEIIGLGEMGIGNTTAASALLCAFTGLAAAESAGRGTGVDDEGLGRKARVIEQALELHRPDPGDPVGVLAAVGGFEIAGMAGAILGAARRGVAVVLDGFISCSAALVARAMEPQCREAMIFSHCSAERGHARMLAALGARPYLDLGMRLGEGTGAALLIGLLASSLALYREMATFAEAAVSGKAEAAPTLKSN